jgi:L-gulonolactone oxidase
MKIKNFGHNVAFTPRHFYCPQTEAEVLEILNNHKNGQVRVAGGLHAWSRAIISDDAFLDVSGLSQIKLEKDNEGTCVIVGGGTKLETLVKVLAKQNFAIPAMGGIMQQTVGGLASTATHGTGRSSFSHYIQSVRVAAYDADGNAKIYEFENGDELLAARTALGCMGVILSLKIPCIPRYWLTESSKVSQTLDEVLAGETEWPLQQTAIIPYSWKFLVFRRKIGEAQSFWGRLRSRLMRVSSYFITEITPHLILKSILLLPWNRTATVQYYKNIMPLLLRESTVTNQDYKGLTLHTRHHYTFRHVEMEVFIPEHNFKPAFSVVRQITEWFAGITSELDPVLVQDLEKAGLLQEVQAAKGSYTLHYIMFIRKVMPDDSLIGMTANQKTRYALGFFTYHRNSARQGYWDFTKTMAKILNRLFDARLHWGKHFPLEHQDIARLYPDMEKFKNICQKVDQKGVFQNEYTRKVFGLES